MSGGPAIATGRAVDFEPGLASSCAVGGEQLFVHEDIALVDGGAIGGVEQWKIGDAAVQQRHVVGLRTGDVLA